MHVDDMEDLDELDVERQLRRVLAGTASTVSGEGVRQEAITRTVARRRRRRWTVRAGIMATGMAATVAGLVAVRADHSPDTISGPSSEPTTTGEPTPSSPTTSSTTSSTSSTSTTPATTALPEFPPELTGLSQGSPAWALYLAVAPQSDSPELLAADAAAGDAGYGSGTGFSNVGCDWGAPEALGVSSDWYSAAVYFETESAAEQARSAFEARGHPPVGVVQVTTYCLD